MNCPLCSKEMQVYLWKGKKKYSCLNTEGECDLVDYEFNERTIKAILDKIHPTPTAGAVRFTQRTEGTYVGLYDCFANDERSDHSGDYYSTAQVQALVDTISAIEAVLKYPRGSEAQIRCLEEVAQDAQYILAQLKGGVK